MLDGVRDASKSQKDLGDGGQINPHGTTPKEGQLSLSTETRTPIRDVEFDVAVTVSKGSETKGGVLVVVGPWTLGSSGKSDSSSNSVSRVRFTVPIGYPRP